MRTYLLVLLAAGCLIVAGCGRVGPTAPATIAEAPEPDVPYDGPPQTAVQGAGQGVVMTPTLRRGSKSFGSFGTTPTWDIEILVANHTNRAVRLGESLIVIEKGAGAEDTAAMYIHRLRASPPSAAREFEARYGLDWGVEVGPGERKPWPWGSVPSSDFNRRDLFLLVVSAPWAEGYNAGGFHTVQAEHQYTLSERVMAPFGLRDRRLTVVVLPPRIGYLAPGHAIQPIFEFRQDGDNFVLASQQNLEITPAALSSVISSAAAPQWERVVAMSLLSETSFTTAMPLLSQIASDEAAPLRLRASAVLNLGANSHAASIPMLQALYESTGDTRLKPVILDSLGDIGDASAAPVIREAIASADGSLRNRAIANAAKMKDAQSVAPIVSVLNATRDEGVQQLCVDSLVQIDTPEAWAGVVAAAQNPRSRFDARRTAILAIGEHKHQPGEAVLVSLASPGQELSIRLNALQALGSFDDDTAFTTITAALNSSDSSVKISAIEALGKMKTPRATQAVAAIAENARNQDTGNAITALGNADPATAGPVLRRLLANTYRSPDDRKSAYRALHDLGGGPGQLTDADHSVIWSMLIATRDRYDAEDTAEAMIACGYHDATSVAPLAAGLDESANPAWRANVLLLKHLTGQDFGPPEDEEGTPQARRVAFDRWRAWSAAHPSGRSGAG